MTTNEITAAIRRKLLETTEDILDNDVILLYVNLALVDTRKRAFPTSDITSSVVNLTAGEATLPATFGTMYGDAKDSANNFYPEVSIGDFERRTLERMVTVEAGKLKVYPTNVTSLTVRYWPKATTLTAGSTPDIDDFFHEAILYGALYRCYEELQDEELAAAYRERFKAEIEERTAVQSSYEETNQRGAVMFTHQTLISDHGLSNSPNGF